MTESILDSIKKLNNIHEDDTSFDLDFVILINAAFSKLHHIGAAPPSGFSITNNEAKWSDFLGDLQNVDMVKAWMALEIRLQFDPPSNGQVLSAFQRQLDELTWRLNTLEFVFNPNAYNASAHANDETIWILETGESFPPEVRNGEIGIDLETREIWRYVDG